MCYATIAFISSAIGCTGLGIVTTDGGSVAGRTLEFGADPQSSVIVFPAGTEFTGTVPSGEGLKFKTKYGFAGASGFETPTAILDALNEKGLYVGLFYFPGYAKYMEPTPENNARGIAPWEFAAWALGNYATVEEVRSAIKQIAIVPTFLKALNEVPGVHYKVQDTGGHCIVVEPIGGELKVYDNPLLVLTNSPEFPWHLTNLNNYLNLTAAYPASKTIGSLKLSPFGMGGGMVGLPGDFTPPSRFIRVTTFLQNLPPQPNAQEAVQMAFHLLNNFDLPPGSNKPPSGTAETYSDYTAWTAVSDLKELRWHWKTFNVQDVHSIDLKKILAKIGSKPLSMPMGSQVQ